MPVIVNIFVLPCVNAQASTKEERKQGNPGTSINSSRPKPRRRKVQVLGDSHARGYAQLIRENMSNNFKVDGFVKPNGRSKDVVDTDITNMTNNDMFVLCIESNYITKNFTEEGLNSIKEFSSTKSAGIALSGEIGVTTRSNEDDDGPCSTDDEKEETPIPVTTVGPLQYRCGTEDLTKS
ncbi:hypothetical protein ANN_10641 [Periplaneta americana]|uniref:Uncharacterized protein n=1 Tax=Periplaneta americana TaxID=6978 RepID=A0ABQ8T4H8_PERAM|nr:hypothetical protein ANN_10641 [Periplaneta americana]